MGGEVSVFEVLDKIMCDYEGMQTCVQNVIIYDRFYSSIEIYK